MRGMWMAWAALALFTLTEGVAQAQFWTRPRPCPGTPPSPTIWIPSCVVRDQGWCGGISAFDALGNLPPSPARPFVPLYDPSLFIQKIAPTYPLEEPCCPPKHRR